MGNYDWLYGWQTITEQAFRHFYLEATPRLYGMVRCAVHDLNLRLWEQFRLKLR
jgi:hypothetical protein